MSYSIFEDTMAEMTGQQFERAAERGALVLIPVGVIEAHGPHLPLGTDVHGSYQMAKLARKHAIAGGVETLIAPPFYWGINNVLAAMPGSFRVRPEIAEGLLSDVFDTLLDSGFRDILVVNHQGDLLHNQMVSRVLQAKHADGQTGVRWLDEGRTCGRLGFTGAEPEWLIYDPPEEWRGGLSKHGGATETALISRYFPELVDWDEIGKLAPNELSAEELATWRKGGTHATSVTPLGFHGNPHPPFDAWRYYDESCKAMGRKIIETYKTDLSTTP